MSIHQLYENAYYHIYVLISLSSYCSYWQQGGSKAFQRHNWSQDQPPWIDAKPDRKDERKRSGMEGHRNAHMCDEFIVPYLEYIKLLQWQGVLSLSHSVPLVLSPSQWTVLHPLERAPAGVAAAAGIISVEGRRWLDEQDTRPRRPRWVLVVWLLTWNKKEKFPCEFNESKSFTVGHDRGHAIGSYHCCRQQWYGIASKLNLIGPGVWTPCLGMKSGSKQLHVLVDGQSLLHFSCDTSPLTTETSVQFFCEWWQREEKEKQSIAMEDVRPELAASSKRISLMHCGQAACPQCMKHNLSQCSSCLFDEIKVSEEG